MAAQITDTNNMPALLPGTMQLVAELTARFRTGNALTTKDLLSIATRHFGATLGAGRYDLRYLYDLAEAALYQVVQQQFSFSANSDVSAEIAQLETLASLLPTQNVRTHEQSLYQQFSSPLPLGCIAVRLLNLGPQDTVIEPSSGTGALAVLARLTGATIITNELSAARRNILREVLGFQPFGVDAEKLDDLLPTGLRPTAVLMNPPFSSTAGRLSRNNSLYGARHIESALRRLQKGGRLVTIAGRGMALDRERMQGWWKRMAARYTVIANVSLPRNLFAKSGTAFDTQLIVIEATGPTTGESWPEQLGCISYGAAATLTEVYQLGSSRTPATRATSLPPPSSTYVPLVPQPAAASPVSVASSVPVTPSQDALIPHEDRDGNGFVPYVAARLRGGAEHPAQLVETASMAAVTPPPITYRPSLPPEVVIDGLLSNTQLERVCYAGQRHEQRLPSGARAGYILQDGTGAGKGRVLAAVILDNFFKGRRRSLWLSISNQLLESTRRDLTALGASDISLCQLNDYDVKQEIALGDGVLFCSYSTLISRAKHGDRTRMEQILEWLGDEGVVIFDESQRAQHAFASGNGEPTLTGQAVVDLQDHVARPNLRFVYSSATTVTEVSHMAYMSRLGLWGIDTSFPGGFTEFLSEIEQGGVGSMEMTSRSMKALGIASCASLSYGRDFRSGLAVEYSEVFHDLTQDQREIYDAAARAWQVCLANMEEALEITGSGKRQRATALSNFWGYHQAFFRQLITAFKVPLCISETEKALAQNESVIISIIGTAESKSKALVTRAIADGNSLAHLDFSPRATLCGMVERAFPVQLYEQKEDPATKTIITVAVTDDKGKPVQCEEAVRMRDALLAELSDLVLPDNPLDQIINHFGPDRVAEITGRRKRLIREPITGEVRYVTRAPKGVPMAKINVHETEQFQAGAKDISVISAAGSTGISLHASLEERNQKRRCHIVLELAWSAVLQMQSFGRSHRSHQAMPPRYVLLSTNVGGERRFSATIARRLQSLGALCKGDRNAADGGSQLSRYAFETTEGRAAVDLLYRRIIAGARVPGIPDPKQALRDMGLLVKTDKGEEIRDRDRFHVGRFLNRILSLCLAIQNPLFDYYSDLFDQCVLHAKATGTYDEGVQDIRARSIQLAGEPQVVHVDKTTGAVTEHFTLAVEIDSERITFADAQSIFNSRPGAFYRNNKTGHIVAAAQSGSHTNPATGDTYRNYSISKPEGTRLFYIHESELKSKYKRIKPDIAEPWWNTQYDATPATQQYELHLIAGAVLPLWQKLKTAKDAQLKVVRVVTGEGQRIVGVKIPRNRVQQVLRALGIATAITEPAAIISAVIADDDHFELADGLSLARTRIYGETYVEVMGVTHHKFTEMRNLGLLNMRIDYQQRFLLPTDRAEAEVILPALLEKYPCTVDASADIAVEVPVVSASLQSLTVAASVDIFDLMQISRPTTQPTSGLASPLPSTAVSPAPANAALVSGQLTFWAMMERAA